jgi:hypothetical protein
MTQGRTYLVYLIAVLIGVAVEFLGFRFEIVMMRLNFPVRLGFSISLFLLIFSPFFSTGLIVYKYTGKLMEGAVLSALVFALTLAITLI